MAAKPVDYKEIKRRIEDHSSVVVNALVEQSDSSLEKEIRSLDRLMRFIRRQVEGPK